MPRPRLLHFMKKDGVEMNFHETKLGHIFFEGQVPKLIQVLQDIATALSRPIPPVKLPVEVKPDFLSDLYWGNYEPSVFQKSGEDTKLDAAVMSTRTALMEALTAEARGRLEAYQAAVDARTSYVLERSYESGYRTAVQMIFAGLAVPEENCAQASEES